MPEPLTADLETALTMLEGDRELLRRIARLFVAQAPGMLQEAHHAIARADARAIERAAHKIRGSVTNFAAKTSYDAASRLEQIGRNGDLVHAEEAHARLHAAVQDLIAVLVELSGDPAS